MMMMSSQPGDSSNVNDSSSVVRRTSSILSSEGRARKPSGMDLPGAACTLHILPPNLSSSLVSVDDNEIAATTTACTLHAVDCPNQSSSSSAEEKGSVNGLYSVTSANNPTIVAPCCQCHDADYTKVKEAICPCVAEKGKNSIYAAATSTADDQLQHVQHHQHGIDFPFSASNLGNLSLGKKTSTYLFY
jgi:hypothetical protein